MRRVARRLFTLCSAASLVLCVAVCVLWARSYMQLDPERPTLSGDDGYWDEAYRHEYLSSHGELEYRWWPDGYVHGEMNIPNYRLAFGFKCNPYCLAMVVPHWFVAALTGVLPFAPIFGVVVRTRRRRLNRCSECGYDLRASPERCPECGARWRLPIPQGETRGRC
jgi:hypothetical protein